MRFKKLMNKSKIFELFVELIRKFQNGNEDNPILKLLIENCWRYLILKSFWVVLETTFSFVKYFWISYHFYHKR